MAVNNAHCMGRSQQSFTAVWNHCFTGATGLSYSYALYYSHIFHRLPYPPCLFITSRINDMMNAKLA